jgi:hypothetical protein
VLDGRVEPKPSNQRLLYGFASFTGSVRPAVRMEYKSGSTTRVGWLGHGQRRRVDPLATSFVHYAVAGLGAVAGAGAALPTSSISISL